MTVRELINLLNNVPENTVCDFWNLDGECTLEMVSMLLEYNLEGLPTIVKLNLQLK